jgi:L-ascorbate metabolism protein UlaG (beta-lactamase superfamily)
MEKATPGTRPPEIDGRFVNLDGTTPDKKGWAVLYWALRHRLPDELRQLFAAFLDLFRRKKSWRPPFHPNSAAALDPTQPHLTWMGPSTFLLRLGGHWILTDPVFGHPAGTLWRHVPSGLPPDQLPPIDLVTLSHDHYDHLDIPSLAAFKGEPQIVAPLRMGRYLPQPPTQGSHLTELDWWQNSERPGLRITLTPAHHWGMRGLTSRNRTLWGGFIYEGDGITIYFAGDSALQPPVFQAIRERFPRIDIAILPIGAYAPRWFMQAQHMDPEEAVDAYKILGARRFVAMHWGTFFLSSEPTREPLDRVRACWAKQGHREEDLWIMDVGETRSLLAESAGARSR